MALTKAQYRTRVLQRADATGSGRWDSTANSEVDNVISQVFDREWRRLLSVNPQLRISKKTPTTDSQGRIVLTDLQTLTGDSQERLFRIHAVVLDNTPYEEVPMRDYLIAQLNDLSERVWWRQGDYLQLLPADASKTADGVWVSHLPTRPDALSADTVSVTFPEGYEEVVILEAAAMLLAKGGAETGGTADLKRLADDYRGEMLEDLCRLSSKPLRFRYDDSPDEWGGQ